jgi:hypothetical protein
MKIPFSVLALSVLTLCGLTSRVDARPRGGSVYVRASPSGGTVVRYTNRSSGYCPPPVRYCPPPVRYCPPPVRYCPPVVIYPCPPPVAWCPPRPIPYVAPGVVFQATFTQGYPAPVPPAYRYDYYRGYK